MLTSQLFEIIMKYETQYPKQEVKLHNNIKAAKLLAF